VKRRGSGFRPARAFRLFHFQPHGKEEKSMLCKQQFSNSLFRTTSRAVTIVLTVAIGFALTIALTQPTQAQTYKVIYNFTGGLDGAGPFAGLTMDQAGNFYGTTLFGGATGNGTVFRLSRSGSGWFVIPLYSFQGGTDGAYPYSRVVFGPDGSLYGTTLGGGYYCGNCANGGCGIVFNLKPPATVPPAALSPWKETVLYRFSGGSDGGAPGTGNLAF